MAHEKAPYFKKKGLKWHIIYIVMVLYNSCVCAPWWRNVVWRREELVQGDEEES